MTNFPLGFLTKILYAFLIAHMRAIWHDPLSWDQFVFIFTQVHINNRMCRKYTSHRKRRQR